MAKNLQTNEAIGPIGAVGNGAIGALEQHFSPDDQTKRYVAPVPQVRCRVKLPAAQRVPGVDSTVQFMDGVWDSIAGLAICSVVGYPDVKVIVHPAQGLISLLGNKV